MVYYVTRARQQTSEAATDLGLEENWPVFFFTLSISAFWFSYIVQIFAKSIFCVTYMFFIVPPIPQCCLSQQS